MFKPPPKPRPVPRTASDELKRMMFVNWGELEVEAGKLGDADRAAALYGIVANPYHQLAFGHLSRMDKAWICINGMIEERQWDKAFRAISRLHRMEREDERDRARQAQLQADAEAEAEAAAEEAEPTPDPAPEPDGQAAPAPAAQAPEAAASPDAAPRLWGGRTLDELVARHPGIADMPAAELRRILSTPAPYT